MSAQPDAGHGIDLLARQGRAERLLDTAELVKAVDDSDLPAAMLRAALTQHLALGQAWLEDLIAENAR